MILLDTITQSHKPYTNDATYLVCRVQIDGRGHPNFGVFECLDLSPTQI
jgi:hypothetical protein